MKPTPSKYCIAATVAIFGLALPSLHAQTAPAPSSATEDTVKLDPFSVSAASDVGFVAANSLAGGRIATALKDTPVSYSVLTSEFLEAFNINDAAKAAEFSVNSNQYVNDGLNGISGATTVNIRIRGQTANTPTRNFFQYNSSSDSYNTDRIDFARGANASLFGSGGSAGTQNTVGKQANNRPLREFRLQGGSNDKYRFTADINQPLTEKASVRTSLLWQRGGTWRDYEWEARKGVTIAGTYIVSPKLTLRAEGEYRTTDKNAGNNHLKDNISAWDGKFTSTPGFDASLTPTQLSTFGINRSPRRYVRDPDNLGQAYNYENTFRTKAAVQSADPTLNNYLNGKPLKSVGFTLNDGAGIAMTEVWDSPDRFATARAGSPYFRLPARSFTPLWDKNYNFPTSWEKAKDVQLFATYRPFENFFVEVSGDHNEPTRWTEYTAAGGMYNFSIDIIRTKPDGSGSPNPYFLHPYSDNIHFAFDQMSKVNSLNLQTAYVKDTRWGRLQLGLMGGTQEEKRSKHQYYFLLPVQNGILKGVTDMRGFFPTTDQNVQAVDDREFLDLRGKVANPHVEENQPVTVTDLIQGTKMSLTPKWYIQPNRNGQTEDSVRDFKFVQVAANLNLFKNHLVIIGAARRDITHVKTNQFLTTDDMPVGWQGDFNTYRPDAPADYYQLTYRIKDATGKASGPFIPAGTRPRTSDLVGVGVPQPQYKDDRFQNDYTTPNQTSAKTTRSYGAVVNLTSWLGLYANDSTTFDLSAGSLNVYNELIPPTSSQSYDAGVRVNLPNGKLALSAGWYRAFQSGQSVGVGSSFYARVNQFANTPVVGDLSETGVNKRGLAPFAGASVNTTRTSQTTGYEVELTANPTRNWRVILNYGSNKPVVKDNGLELPGWMTDHDALFRQIMADAGILINSSNQASINPAVNDPTKINVTRVQASVDAYNLYMSQTVPALIAATQAVTQSSGGPVETSNLATDYRFTTGWLKGIRAGIAANYRGRQILGATTSNSIPDPNNPALAIKAPDSTSTSYLWVGGYVMGTGNLSYTVKMKETTNRLVPKTIQFDVAISNLFNKKSPVLDNSTTGSATTNALIYVPRDNDVSNPGIMARPGAYNFAPPREYTLTAKLNF